MKRFNILIQLLAGLLLASCSTLTSAMSVDLVVGSSDTCTLQQGERVPVSLIGRLPPGATVHWSAVGGTVDPRDDALATIFEASTTETRALVTARIDYQGGSIPKNINCQLSPAPTVEQGVVATEPPPPTATELPPPLENTPEPAATVLPAPIEFASLTPTTGATNVAITEVMANPCGGEKEQVANEYVELFNYGLAAVDISDWFIFVTGQTELPDPLVAWETRNPGTNVGNAMTNTTVILPGQYALILQPGYLTVESEHQQVYTRKIPANTVILTIGENEVRLGNKVNGIITSGKGVVRDSLFIYRGEKRHIIKLVTTYGIYAAGPDPSVYSRIPGLGLEAQRCDTVVRKFPSLADDLSNWKVEEEASPGY